MGTTIYWAVQHVRSLIRQQRFQFRCWWLGQQVEFLDWRMKLEPILSSVQSGAQLVAVGKGDCPVVQPAHVHAATV
jgi:hypothetical protein